MSRLHPTFQEPDIQIDDAALYSWKQDQLDNADALLTAAIPDPQGPNHHVLASRALSRTVSVMFLDYGASERLSCSARLSK